MFKKLLNNFFTMVEVYFSGLIIVASFIALLTSDISYISFIAIGIILVLILDFARKYVQDQ
jgi:hypothetical protein